MINAYTCITHINNTRDEMINDTMKKKSSNHEFYFCSVKAFYLKYGGQEVYNYLNDLNGFNSMQGSDTSATVALPTTPPIKPIVNTITGGMNQLPERLVDMFLQACKKYTYLV